MIRQLTLRSAAAAVLAAFPITACESAEERSAGGAALDTQPAKDGTPAPDAVEGDASAPDPAVAPLLAALRANGGALAYDLTLSGEADEFTPWVDWPVTVHLVVAERPGGAEEPRFTLTAFAPSQCDGAATVPARLDGHGLVFARDLSVVRGTQTVTLLAGHLAADGVDGGLAGEAHVEVRVWMCDTEKSTEETVALRAVPERTPPVVAVTPLGELPPFPRVAVSLDEQAQFRSPYGLVVDGIPTANQGRTEDGSTLCGPAPWRPAVPVPWGAEVRVAVPALFDGGGNAAAARNLPFGRVVAAPSAPFTPSFEADDLAGVAVVGDVRLIGAGSPLPADDGVNRVRASGATPWALAFEADVPADPSARLELSVRTLRGLVEYGTDTEVPAPEATLVVRVGTSDAGTTQPVPLPAPVFDPPTSAAVPIEVPLGNFAGRRVVVQLDASETCRMDGCGGRTCVDLLFDGLRVLP
jgi:hypothetical protein